MFASTQLASWWVSLLQARFRIDSVRFLYYKRDFVLILSVSLLQDRFRIDYVRFFITGVIAY